MEKKRQIIIIIYLVWGTGITMNIFKVSPVLKKCGTSSLDQKNNHHSAKEDQVKHIDRTGMDVSYCIGDPLLGWSHQLQEFRKRYPEHNLTEQNIVDRRNAT